MYSSNPESVNFPLYCKYQLLRYKPWVPTQSNAWNDIEPSDDVFINAWREFLQTPLAQSSVPNWLNKLADIENQYENSLNEGHLPIDNTDDTDREEWMILSDLTVAFHRSFNTLSSNFNSHQTIRNIPCNKLEKCLHGYPLKKKLLCVKQILSYSTN